MKKLALSVLVILIIGSIIAYFWIINSNNFQLDGTLDIDAIENEVSIHRDEHGVAYVFAESKADVIRGQGFVVAQDRLFQIEFYRALIQGKLSSILGNSQLQSDIKMRVLNMPAMAERNYKFLNQEAKEWLNWYCEGHNEYLENSADEFPVELGLIGLEPQPLQPIDLLTIIHFIGYNHAKNMGDEILSLNLNALTDVAAELSPISINPDRTAPLMTNPTTNPLGQSAPQLFDIPKVNPTLLPSPSLGSNNWAINGEKSDSGKPIVCNDPHVDSRMLPGVFYPIGLFCPEFKAVGLSIPAIPGVIIGRTEHLAFGVTNGYGDSQDLYIENDTNIIETKNEIIKVKDSSDVEITVRYTKTGPIISDFDIFGILTDDIVSLGWSQAETTNSSLGLETMLEAKDIMSFRTSLFQIDNMFFNYIFGDTDGGIAHQTTGLIPIRSDKNGRVAHTISQNDHWIGFIPKDSMPHMINPERNWVGTANHDTRPDAYPYYYSSHFSPHYRYSRMSEVFSEEKQFTSDDLWNLILDCKNKQAEILVPIYVSALETHDETQNLANRLKSWNQLDDIDEVGPSIYHVLSDELFNLILNDELPDELEEQFWGNGYYWEQSLDSIILRNDALIDNIQTPEKENLKELIITAGLHTQNYLKEQLGTDPDQWKWGKIHTLEFISPIKPDGVGSTWLGAEKMPKKGSKQTLNRGGYNKGDTINFETGWFSSFRMVADLNDTEKMRGALSGGSASRILHPYYKSQVDTWKNEEWIPYWISEKKVKEHSKHLLQLN